MHEGREPGVEGLTLVVRGSVGRSRSFWPCYAVPGWVERLDVRPASSAAGLSTVTSAGATCRARQRIGVRQSDAPKPSASSTISSASVLDQPSWVG